MDDETFTSIRHAVDPTGVWERAALAWDVESLRRSVRVLRRESPSPDGALVRWITGILDAVADRIEARAHE